MGMEVSLQLHPSLPHAMLATTSSPFRLLNDLEPSCTFVEALIKAQMDDCNSFDPSPPLGCPIPSNPRSLPWI